MKNQLKTLLIYLTISFLLILKPVSGAENHDRDITAGLKPFVATYLVTAMGLEGINVTNSLSLNINKLKQQEYHFKSYSMTVGVLAFSKDETRDEQSRGLLFAKQIQPELYTYVQTRNNKIRKNVEITFDWENKQVINRHIKKKSQWTMPIPEKTIDKLSYQLALMQKLAQQPEKKFSFKIADGGKIKEYQFNILAEERVFTSLGSFKALKIKHRRHHQDKTLTLWCVAELNYLPVKIIQEETDKPTFISTLISYQEGLTEHQAE